MTQQPTMPVDQPQNPAPPPAFERPDVGRPIIEIILDLRKPVKNEMLKQREQGGKMLTYIPWYNCVKILDMYAPGWSYRIDGLYPVGENHTALVVTLDIPALEGTVSRSATGIEVSNGVKYGDTTSNAESQALRRAAAKFGLGLYLYDKPRV